MIGQKVLLISNDAEFLKLTSMVFREVGTHVITAQNGMEGNGKALAHQPDLIIMDVMLPEKDGYHGYQKIRQFSNTPLIMLSTLDQDQHLLQARDSGADDFFTKPINPEILLARARTMMLSNEQSKDYRAAFNYDDGHLKINAKKHRVKIRNKRVKLTPVELRLLIFLASNADTVLTFEQILAYLWGSEQEGNNSYVHVYISLLRSKIEVDTKHPRYILSVRGVGYIFEKRARGSPAIKASASLATS